MGLIGMGVAGSEGTESFNPPYFAPGMESRGFTGDGATVVASRWCITFLQCSWIPGSLHSSPRIGLDESPTPFWGAAGVAGFQSFACSLAWLCKACFRVSGTIRETRLWLCVCAGISTRQKTYHDVTDIRTGQGID